MIFSPVFLRIKDFMSHSDSEIDFELFSSALITGQKFGDERFSNATGKSTILKAISFVLFDQYPANKNDIIRDGQKICEVSFDFNIDNILYRINRRKSNKSKAADVLLYRFDGKDWISEEGRTNAQTEEEIKKLIKVNYESFKNSVLFEQGTFSELLEATPTKKREILKKPLNLALYSEFEKNIKAKTKEVDKQLSEVNTTVSLLGNPKEDINYYKEQVDKLSSDIVLIEANRCSIEKQLELNNDKKINLEKVVSSSDNSEVVFKVNQVNKDIESTNSTLLKLEQFKKSKTQQLKSFNNSIEQYLKSAEDAKLKLREIDSQIDELEKIELRSDEDINKEIQELSERERNGIKHIGSVESNIDKYSKPLPHGEACPLCFNELNEEYREKISTDNLSKLNELKLNLEKSKAKFNKIIQLKNQLNDELKNNKNIRDKISKLKIQDKNVPNFQISSSESSIKDARINFSKVSSEIEDIDNSLVENNKKIEELNVLKLDLEKQLSKVDLTITYNELKEVNQNISFLKNEDKEFVSQFASFRSNKAVLESKIETREKDIIKLDELFVKKQELEKSLRVHLKATKAFSSSGIPNLIVQTILDDIQVEANKVLLDIRPDLSLKFIIDDAKDSLDIVYVTDGKERHVELLSGGQKMYYSFALKLGMSFVLQKRLGVDIKMLQLDEVDQPIDEAGRDAYVDIIKKFQNKMKILVITHNNRLKSKFSNAIVVENSGNLGSKAKVISI